MPQFNSLYEAQAWADKLGDEALDLVMALVDKQANPVVPVMVEAKQGCAEKPAAPTEAEILSYITSQRMATHTLVSTGDKTARVFGFTLKQILDLRRIVDMAQADPDRLDLWTMVPSSIVQGIIEEAQSSADNLRETLGRMKGELKFGP